MANDQTLTITKDQVEEIRRYLEPICGFMEFYDAIVECQGMPYSANGMVLLHVSGSGASASVTCGQLRRVGEAMNALNKISPPDPDDPGF